MRANTIIDILRFLLAKEFLIAVKTAILVLFFNLCLKFSVLKKYLWLAVSCSNPAAVTLAVKHTLNVTG